MHQILITANQDLAAPLFKSTSVPSDKVLHLPLELFRYKSIKKESDYVLEHFSSYSFIIHGNLRNARFYVEWLHRNKAISDAQQIANLVLDKPTSEFLEQNKIPAIMPKKDAKPIDLLEFMIRISKEGISLYPSSKNKAEEMPGLLKELDMTVHEFVVCEEKQVSESTLDNYLAELSSASIDTVLFHNRSSVIRTLTAFPDLPYSSLKLVAGSNGAEKKMEEEDLTADQKANGTWKSIAELLV